MKSWGGRKILERTRTCLFVFITQFGEQSRSVICVKAPQSCASSASRQNNTSTLKVPIFHLKWLTVHQETFFLNSVTLFSLFIMCTILTNCCFMAMSEPAYWAKYLEWVHLRGFLSVCVLKESNWVQGGGNSSVSPSFRRTAFSQRLMNQAELKCQDPNVKSKRKISRQVGFPLLVCVFQSSILSGNTEAVSSELQQVQPLLTSDLWPLTNPFTPTDAWRPSLGSTEALKHLLGC